MKILSVNLKSFRQHRDAKFDFTGAVGDFVVIKGNNGAGKTTFLNAVTWCLYDVVDGLNTYSRESLVSQSDIVDSKPGDGIVTEVEVTIALQEGGRASITRTINFVRVEEGVKVVSNTFNVLAQEDTAAGFINQSDPQEWIDNRLPTRFSPYFLFDGERLDRFFKDSDARFIKSSVMQIAKIDMLELTVKHLETVAEGLTKEAAKLSGAKGDEQANDYDILSKRINEGEEELAGIETLVNATTDAVHDINGRLGDISQISELMEQRKSIQGLYQTALDRVSDTEDELTSWALQAGPSILLAEPLAGLNNEIEAARKNQVLPPPFAPEALKGLLEAEECICGASLTEGADGAGHIAHIIEKYGVISEVGEVLSSLEAPLHTAVAGFKSARTTADRILQRIKSSRAEVQGLEKKLEGLNQRLEGHNDEEVAMLHDQLRKAELARDAAIENRGRLREQIKAFRERRQEIEKLIASQENKSVLAKEAIRKSEFAKRTMQLAQTVYDELSDAVRNDVASNLDTQFKTMIWKKDFVQEVGIDSNFRVSVVNNRGFEILGELSAGERICLAFAYSLTLAVAAGIRFPFVVDSPMGKLGPEVQDNLAKVLATETEVGAGDEAQQLILLMTDTEYTSSVQAILATRNPIVYSINFDVAVSETRIVRELN